MNNIGESEIEK